MVRVGEIDLLNSRYGQFVGIRAIISHRQYDPVTLKHDIAVLKLATDLVFNDYVTSICAFTKMDLTASHATVLGYGSHSFGGYHIFIYTAVQMKLNFRLKLRRWTKQLHSARG